MATTLVASGTLGNVPNATGQSNQNHQVYGVNSARWFLFVVTATDTTHVNVYVSSSNDLSTATWATIGTGTQSPVLAASATWVANEARTYSVGYQNIASTDVCYIDAGPSGTNVSQEIRVTLTATVATWGAWDNVGSGAAANTPDGSAVGISTTNRAWILNSRTNADRDLSGRTANNADSGTSWTTGWTQAGIDNSMAQVVNSGALMPLASGFMLAMADSGVVAATTTNHIFKKSTSATAWPANSAASTIFASATAAAQDKNDWSAVETTTADVHVVRRKDATNFEHRRTTDGVTWGTLVTISASGLTGHLAGSGIGLASDGTDVWMMVIDTDANKNIKYLHWTSAGGWDAAWSTLSTSDTNVKAFISVSKATGNSQIGVMWTENTATPFAIVGSYLSTSVAIVPYLPPRDPIFVQRRL